MKLFRKPSLKKSLSARTTGAWTRKAKRSVNPFYGKKGMGLYTNPKKHFYNKGYYRATRSVYGSSRGNSAGLGIVGISAIIIIAFFISCMGSIFGSSNDNKSNSTSNESVNSNAIANSSTNSSVVENTIDSQPASESMDNTNLSENTETMTAEIYTNEPDYYSSYSDEELAINRYVLNYINTDTVCPFNEDNIEEYYGLAEEHKVLLSFSNRFEKNILLFMQGYYHTKHYFTMELREWDTNSDEELIPHVKDCISVIYPDLSEDEIYDIINRAKESGEEGYTYNADFNIVYECISPSYSDTSKFYYTITYK